MILMLLQNSCHFKLWKAFLSLHVDNTKDSGIASGDTLAFESAYDNCANASTEPSLATNSNDDHGKCIDKTKEECTFEKGYPSTHDAESADQINKVDNVSENLRQEAKNDVKDWLTWLNKEIDYSRFEHI